MKKKSIRTTLISLFITIVMIGLYLYYYIGLPELLWMDSYFEDYLSGKFVSPIVTGKPYLAIPNSSFKMQVYFKDDPETVFYLLRSRGYGHKICSTYPVVMWKKEMEGWLPKIEDVTYRIYMYTTGGEYNHNKYFDLGEKIPSYADDEKNILNFFEPPQISIDIEPAFFNHVNSEQEFCNILYSIISNSKYCTIGMSVYDGVKSPVIDVYSANLQGYSKDEMMELYNSLIPNKEEVISDIPLHGDTSLNDISRDIIRHEELSSEIMISDLINKDVNSDVMNDELNDPDFFENAISKNEEMIFSEMTVSDIITYNHELECALVGYWHEAPGIPAGWAERYIFYPNYTFSHFTSEMDGLERTLSFSGTWFIREGNLHLEVTEKVVLVGGNLVPSTGSIGTEEQIEGGDVIIIDLSEEPETQEIDLGSVEVIENYKYTPDTTPYAFKRKFGEKYFWKFINMD
ncbi:MAG: hypothetical protein LBS21_04075 [Clostridiales bacterium]|nr:hypothetical protein [Clostridiales bacterium]